MGITRLLHCAFVALAAAGLCLQPASASTPTEQRSQSTAQSRHFLDVPALLENRADTATSPLLVGVKTPQLQSRPSQPGYLLSSATLVRENDEPGGFLVLVRQSDGGFIALVNTLNQRGIVLGKADGTQTFHEEKRRDHEEDDMVPDPLEHARAEAGKASGEGRSGNIVVTVLVGFSRAAAEAVGDPTAFALGQLETVNLGLRNSGVDGVSVVLVGINISETNPPMVLKSVGLLPTLFPNYPRASLVTAFFMPTPEDDAIGWGSTPGRYTMQLAWTTDTFAHELGHNAGGKHCNTSGENNYAFGHSNGDYGSFLCRGKTTVPSYSTPNRSAPDGVPLGNARTADMARVWREQAHRLASYEESSPFLIQSGAETSECVDAHSQVVGGQVGLWKCDQNNPNQRWVQVRVGNKILIRLKAHPTLCLAKGVLSAIPDLILRECHELHAWEELGNQLRILNKQKLLYLNRKSDSTLEATENSGSQPGSHWQKLPVAETPRFLIQSVADPSQCVDAHGYTEEAKVGLWRCDKNNPNQQWEQVQTEKKVMIRLKSTPTICLSKGDHGSTRDVVLKMCNEDNAWEEIAGQLRILGDKEFLYLNRTSSNTLEASEGSGSQLGSRWEMDYLPTP